MVRALSYTIKMSMKSSSRSAVVVSSSSTKPKSLIKLITRNAELSEDHPHKISTSWRIDTKYYTTDINIHGITEYFERDVKFNESVEALIIHMDSNRDTGLKDLQKWEQLEKDCNPEIKLLISNYCTNETKITKTDAIEWCLMRGYELVELYPNAVIVNHEDNDEVPQEKFGVKRVIEALETHIWPNLVMKDTKNAEKQKEKAQISELSDSTPSVNEGLSDLLMGIDNCVNNMDDFTDLFSKLQGMKDGIQSLPSRDRKKQAEEMVTAFWRAIGGDEEEIDLSDL